MGSNPVHADQKEKLVGKTLMKNLLRRTRITRILPAIKVTNMRYVVE